MQSIDPANLVARGGRRRAFRDFITFIGKDRSDNAEVVFNYWSGLRDTDAAVFNPDTGQDEVRSFKAAGALIAVSSIPRVSNLTIQTVRIEMSGVSDEVNQFFRTYEARQARVEIYRAECDPETFAFVAAAEPRFLGFVDSIEVIHGTVDNGESSVSLSCKSHSQELGRANNAKVSLERGKLRDPSDAFFTNVAEVGEWEYYSGLSREA